MNSAKREQLRLFFTEFYEKSFKLLDNDNFDEIFDFYYQTIKDLENLVPINFIGDKAITPDKNYVVIANHIATPSLTLINDHNKIKSFGIVPTSLYFHAISPFIFRHYPIAKYLSDNDFLINPVSYSTVRRLDAVRKYWGNIIVNKRSTNKMKRIAAFIQSLPLTNHAITFFPEGADSHFYLDDTHYGLIPFKSGFLRTARMFKLPILPISLTFDRDKYVYHVKINEVFDYDSYVNEDSYKFTHKMESVIAQGMREAQKAFRNG